MLETYVKNKVIVETDADIVRHTQQLKDNTLTE